MLNFPNKHKLFCQKLILLIQEGFLELREIKLMRSPLQQVEKSSQQPLSGECRRIQHFFYYRPHIVQSVEKQDLVLKIHLQNHLHLLRGCTVLLIALVKCNQSLLKLLVICIPYSLKDLKQKSRSLPFLLLAFVWKNKISQIRRSHQIEQLTLRG